MTSDTPHKVLVLAAHPDDEVLGCGGTIARHTHRGDEVRIQLVADGETSRDQGPAPEQRHQAMKDAAALLNVSHAHCLGLMDNQLDAYPLLDLIKKVNTALDGYAPDIVYTHSHGDLNIDHRIVYQIAMTLFRPLPGSRVKKILGFEVPSATGWMPPETFSPRYFVDITTYYSVKTDALHAYGKELAKAPHIRSFPGVEALNRYRGFSMGVEYAEAFDVYRIIE